MLLRVRYDRPSYAADADITFRSTEPAKITAGTYAPLMLFVWLTRGYAVAGKLVDVYGLDERLADSLADRPLIPNRDGTKWFPVPIEEVVAARALLRQGDRNEWAPAVLGGTMRAKWLLDNWRSK